MRIELASVDTRTVHVLHQYGESSSEMRKTVWRGKQLQQQLLLSRHKCSFAFLISDWYTSIGAGDFGALDGDELVAEATVSAVDWMTPLLLLPSPCSADVNDFDIQDVDLDLLNYANLTVLTDPRSEDVLRHFSTVFSNQVESQALSDGQQPCPSGNPIPLVKSIPPLGANLCATIQSETSSSVNVDRLHISSGYLQGQYSPCSSNGKESLDEGIQVLFS